MAVVVLCFFCADLDNGARAAFEEGGGEREAARLWPAVEDLAAAAAGDLALRDDMLCNARKKCKQCRRGWNAMPMRCTRWSGLIGPYCADLAGDSFATAAAPRARGEGGAETRTEEARDCAAEGTGESSSCSGDSDDSSWDSSLDD